MFENMTSILKSVAQFNKDSDKEEFIKSICKILGKEVPNEKSEDILDNLDRVCKDYLNPLIDHDENLVRIGIVKSHRKGKGSVSFDASIFKQFLSNLLKSGCSLKLFKAAYVLPKSYGMMFEDDLRMLFENEENATYLIQMGWITYSLILKLMLSSKSSATEDLNEAFHKWNKFDEDSSELIIMDQWIFFVRAATKSIVDKDYDVSTLCDLIQRVKPIFLHPTLGPQLEEEKKQILKRILERKLLEVFDNPCASIWTNKEILKTAFESHEEPFIRDLIYKIIDSKHE